MLNAINILKDHKLKVTPARIHILELFSEHCKPMNVEDIAKKLHGADVVTVYRTLQTFEKLKIVQQVDLRKGSVFYELTDHHHHHIVCTDCGKVEEFELCVVPEIEKSILKKSKSFKHISEHSLELFGVCKACVKQ
jgi:Fur family ferric uptake transcriptional regulator